MSPSSVTVPRQSIRIKPPSRALDEISQSKEAMSFPI